MRRVNVTVISCIYGDSHDRFLAEWEGGIRRLDPQPESVIVATDHPRAIRCAKVVIASAIGKHKQAYHLNRALRDVETEWVWIHDIDDIAHPDALEGIENVDADVWQLGYERSDGMRYLPPQLVRAEVLLSERNPFVAGSCIRTEALRRIGGFPDLALQDWAIWRRLARADATFESSRRTHFWYRRHASTRGRLELTLDRRAADMEEMFWAESHAVAV